MALFFTVTLAVSIVGMIVVLAMRRYELNTGHVFLAGSRPAIGAFFHRKLVWVEYVLPGLVRVGIKRAYLFARAVARVWIARGALYAEQRLEQALRRVRRTTSRIPRRGHKSSTFLREVTEHKKEVRDNLPDKIVIEE